MSNHCEEVHGTRCPVKDSEHSTAYREKAKELHVWYSDGDVNVDECAVVSESDEGAYVAAWVWVPREAIGLPSLEE